MQNNLITCIIIAYLCIIASIIVGAVSVLARLVPAAMVNAFLYLITCKFLPIISSSLIPSPNDLVSSSAKEIVVWLR